MKKLLVLIFALTLTCSAEAQWAISYDPDPVPVPGTVVTYCTFRDFIHVAHHSEPF
jgi:hypothetical protein